MSRQAKPTPPPPVLPEYWPYSYVTRPVSWAITVWLTAVVAHAFNLPVLYAVAATVLAALLGPLAAAGTGAPLRTRWFAGMLAVAIGGYLIWTTATTPLTRTAGLALLPGTAVFGVWWHWIVVLHDNARDAELLRLAAQEKVAVSDDFCAILAQAGFKNITAAGPVEVFEAGTTQTLTLPPSGAIELKALQAAVAKIEIAARAEYPIRFLPGRTSSQVVVLRLTKDVLAERLPYPVDRNTPKSIHQPLSLGKDELGVVQVVTFRELSAMFAGERGTGKSGLINTHLAHLTACKDALVWMIDGKGGRTMMPWLKPFLEGIGKPALDFCATTDEEADAVIMAARAVVECRPDGFAEKVHPSPSQPAIILIVEEASIVTGTGDLKNSRRAERMKQVVVLGRSEAVDAVLVTQRGTVTMLGSGDMKSQLQYIVGLGISKIEDALRIFGDVSMAREMLRYADNDDYKGVMLVKAPGLKTVTPVKGWYVDPEAIPSIAETNARWRPELEPETAQYVHDVLTAAGFKGGYFGRWDRFKEQLSARSSRGGGTASGGVSTLERGTVGTAPVGTGGTSGGGTPGADRGREIVERAKAQAAAARERSEFDAIVAGWNDDDVEPPADIPPAERDDPDVIPPILRCMVAVFHGRSEERLPTQVILDHLPGDPINATRLGRLMGHCGVASIENVPTEDGKRARGYARADLLRALARARDNGDMPIQAFDWQP